MVNINPNEPKDENYVHDYMEDVPQNWWIGCIAIITFVLIVVGAIILIIIYGG